MTDGMFCAQCLSQYQEILSKTRLFGTRNCSKLGRSLYQDDKWVIMKGGVHWKPGYGLEDFAQSETRTLDR